VSKENDMLRSNVEACRQRLAKLAYSVNKNRELFPLTINTVKMLTDDQEESVDAFNPRGNKPDVCSRHLVK
jgi:hypothetical protein